MTKALRHLKRADPIIGRIIEKVGPYGIEYSPAGFSTIVRCITYQQLSGKAALKIYGRLEAATGNGDGLTPEAALAIDADTMRSLGFSRQKIDYIHDFARACLDGHIDLDALAALPDAEVGRLLSARRGIGPWTVHMYLIFALRRLDVLPVGDLGVRVAMRKAYGLDALPAAAEMERIAAPWRPYATVATWYLWRSLGDGAGLDPVID